MNGRAGMGKMTQWNIKPAVGTVGNCSLHSGLHLFWFSALRTQCKRIQSVLGFMDPVPKELLQFNDDLDAVQVCPIDYMKQ